MLTLQLKCVITLAKLRKSFGTCEQKMQVSKMIQALQRNIVTDENWNFTDIAVAHQLRFDLDNSHVESMYNILE